MIFMHLADLHIGKNVNGFSMLKDQEHVINQVLALAKERKKENRLDGVLLAGDIYDKSIPSGEAVQLLDSFLTALSDLQIPVYMISGNHDSGERLAFGAKLFEKSGLHMESIYKGCLKPIVLQDEYGPLNLYMLPFVKPVNVRRFLERSEDMDEDISESEIENTTIKTYHDAVERVLEEASVDASARNLLVAHQFVTGASKSGSESVSVGGVDNVDAELFSAFDYVALGHIHGSQHVTRKSIRYAGTLLKYSFSECNHNKSITMVELKGKGEVDVETIPIKPLHDMEELRGNFEELISKEFSDADRYKNYFRVILTDENIVLNAMNKLRMVYPNIMSLEYEGQKERMERSVVEVANRENKQPIEFFKDFYYFRKNETLSEEKEAIVSDIMKEIWG